MLALVVATFAELFAIMLVVRRMIEFSGGETRLARISFIEQFRLSCRVLGHVLWLSLAMALLVPFIGGGWSAGRNWYFAPVMLLGFDGIAFDQSMDIGRVWSSALAAIVFSLLVQAGAGENSTFLFREALRELRGGLLYVVPAIIAVAVFQIGFSYAQGTVRVVVVSGWFASPAWPFLKDLGYFFFVVAFAAIRLWVTMAIFTVALRQSYRHDQRG